MSSLMVSHLINGGIRSHFKIMVYIQGNNIIATDNGINNIVALSSIHLNLGHSAATQIGAINIANQIGVLNRK